MFNNTKKEIKENEFGFTYKSIYIYILLIKHHKNRGEKSTREWISQSSQIYKKMNIIFASLFSRRVSSSKNKMINLVREFVWATN